MKITEQWSVSPEYLSDLQGLSKAKLMKLIEGKNFFGGYPLGYAEKKNKEIYATIHSRGAKNLTKAINASKNPKGNGKDNPKG